MAIIKKTAKNGRLLYYDESNGRFSNAAAWVKQNFDIIVKVDEHGNDFKSIYLIYLSYAFNEVLTHLRK